MNAEGGRESVLAPEPNEIRWVCGVDLSGPANAAGTAVECFSLQDGRLDYHSSLCPASDAQIVECVGKLAESGAVAIGLDAPLSYKDGGGMRDCDKELSSRLKKKGFNFIGVMPPLLTFMAYLTLRGVVLARGLELTCGNRVHVVEVHPGAAMALQGAPKDALAVYKKSEKLPPELRGWLVNQGLHDLPEHIPGTSHQIDAAAAVLATWKWLTGKHAWLAPADPPARPYDFAC